MRNGSGHRGVSHGWGACAGSWEQGGGGSDLWSGGGKGESPANRYRGRGRGSGRGIFFKGICVPKSPGVSVEGARMCVLSQNHPPLAHRVPTIPHRGGGTSPATWGLTLITTSCQAEIRVPVKAIIAKTGQNEQKYPTPKWPKMAGKKGTKQRPNGNAISEENA